MSSIKSFVENEIGIIAVAAMVAGVGSRFLPPTPGIETIVTLVGAISAVAGVAIAVVLRPLDVRSLVLAIVLSLVIGVIAILAFFSIASGEPGQTTAYWLYLCTVALFGSMGFLVDVARLKITQ